MEFSTRCRVGSRPSVDLNSNENYCSTSLRSDADVSTRESGRAFHVKRNEEYISLSADNTFKTKADESLGLYSDELNSEMSLF